MATPHYVSQETLNTVLDLLKENRDVVREQIKVIGVKVDDLSDQLTEAATQITTRQDMTNGRVSRAETAIDFMKKEVDQILTEGCDQKHKHEQDVALLRGSGALPVYEEEPTIVRTPIPYMGDPESRRRILKKVGVGSGLVGLGALLPHLINGLHWVFDHVAVK